MNNLTVLAHLAETAHTSEQTSADGDGGQVSDAVLGQGALDEDVALADQVLLGQRHSCVHERSALSRENESCFEKKQFGTIQLLAHSSE
jgi:hypothetical protein